MSMDKKLSKTQLTKIIQTDGSFGSWLGSMMCTLNKKSNIELCCSIG